MTAFISEFRSMTFQCKSEIQFSGVNNSYVAREHVMPPHQDHAQATNKGPDPALEAEQSRENQVSPVSSLGGTSVESSSPVMTTSNGMNRSYELDRAHMVVDPSSDDSGSMTNDTAGYQDEMPSPLEQLQCALGKDGMLGQKLHLSDYPGQKDDVRSGSNASLSSADQQPMVYYDSGEMFKCHLCSYATNSKQDFNVHMNSHFDHKCPFCDYTSRTEGRLKRHVKDFHSETPPESWAGTRVPRGDMSGAEQSMDDSVTSSNGKSRTYRCKQCDFVAYQKNDFWEHTKSHIKAEKLLSCPQCAFVTEYKHHLEYHIRNHFGSKPFKCSKCNYSCVNKSMLNSHMKSHSNIYQYRCANCTYATKYCHSLKLHLRKYEHKPATVLNMDGTPNPYPVIDVYGTRRGPRTKKRRCMDDSENTSVSSTAAVSSQPSLSYPSSVPLLPPNVPVMYPQFFNGYPNNLYMKAHQPNENPNYPLGMSHVRVKHDSPFKCIICDFVTDHQEMYHKHMILHAAAENQDLVKLYGINSESLLHFQDQLMFNNYLQGQKYLEHHSNAERKDFNNFEQLRDRLSNGYQHNAKAIKEEEEENSNNFHRSDKNISPKTVHESEDLTSLMAPNSAFKDERAETDDNERTVIVAHKSSPKPPIVTEASDSFTPHPKSKNMDHSPLDLSGPKSSDSAQKSEGSKTPDATFENDEIKVISPNGTDHSANQRNRRKGKAFKIDHYMQLDQPPSSETPTPINYQTLPEEPQKNQAVHPSPDVAQLQPEVLSTRENKTLTQEASQDLPHQQSNPVNSTSRNPSPHYSLGNSKSIFECHEMESRKSCSPFILKDATQYSKEMPLNHCRNSSQAQSMLSKMEIESEQKSNPAKRQQEIFECEYCAMAFRDCVMYTVHMGYHGFGDPFTCNMCGQESKDRVEFFIHIARAAHV